MNPSDRLEIPAQVMARQIGEEVVILDLSKGSYFGLDPVGARVWQLIGERKSLGEICDAMQEIFEVSREDIERDVASLAESLLAQQLLTRP